jgi:hypothetical protein
MSFLNLSLRPLMLTGTGVIFSLLLSLSCSPLLKKPETPAKLLAHRGPQTVELNGVHLNAHVVIGNSDPLRIRHRYSVALMFWDEAKGNMTEGPYVDPGYVVSAYLWMVMPGGESHGSSPVTVSASFDATNQVIPGVFQVDGIVFSMYGDWQIHIELKNVDGEVIHAFVQDIHV